MSDRLGSVFARLHHCRAALTGWIANLSPFQTPPRFLSIISTFVTESAHQLSCARLMSFWTARAAQRGVETRRRNREAREQANAATHEAEPQAQQPEAAKRQTKRPEATAVRGSEASAAMATVARAPRGVRCESPNALVTR